MRLQCRQIYTAGQDQPSFQPGSVTRARSSLPDPHIQWKPTVNGNGGEFPACYNKVEPSILVTKAIRYSQATPRIHHFQCQKVISVGRHTAGDHQFMVQQLRPLVFFLHNSIIMHLSWVSGVIAVKSSYNCFWTEETFFC